MRIQFMMICLPESQGNMKRVCKDNIPLVNFKKGNPHLWFLWEKSHLKECLSTGNILYRNKKL